MASTATPATVGAGDVDDALIENHLRGECSHYGVVYIKPGGKAERRIGTKEVDYGRELTAKVCSTREEYSKKRRAALNKAIERAKHKAAAASDAGAWSSSAAGEAPSPISAITDVARTTAIPQQR